MNGLKAFKVKKLLKTSIILLGIILIGSFGYLVSGHYDSDQNAANYLPTTENDSYLTYRDKSDIGFIFYPGAKVESNAYSYLSDITANVYIAKFPFELAMFDYKVADQIIADNPQITKWYIGGHSLGGVFANRYAITSTYPISGLVFLGSYPAAGDQSNLPGIALFGDRDTVVGDYHQKADLFTNDQRIIELTMASHSGFGNYGQQKGDTSLTPDEIHQQQKAIIEQINNFIQNT